MGYLSSGYHTGFQRRKSIFFPSACIGYSIPETRQIEHTTSSDYLGPGALRYSVQQKNGGSLVTGTYNLRERINDAYTRTYFDGYCYSAVGLGERPAILTFTAE